MGDRQQVDGRERSSYLRLALPSYRLALYHHLNPHFDPKRGRQRIAHDG